MRRRRTQDDDGSILLSFLAMLILSGLLLVVAATVLNGQQQNRFDKNFEQALQVAEVGQGQLVSLIQSKPDMTTLDPITGETADGGSYSASAVKDGYFWTVTSTGTSSDGKTRTVEVKVRVRPLFGFAAFGKESMTLNGGNGADSYDSAVSTDVCKTYVNGDWLDLGIPTNAATNSSDAKVCVRTGIGTVATNGDLFLKGQVATDADRFEVHHARRFDDGQAPPGVPDPLPGATGRCVGAAETCSAFTGESGAKGRYFREPIEVPPINQCNEPDTVPAPYHGDSPAAGQHPLRGERYFFTDAVLTGRSLFTGTVNQPTILCISGKLTIGKDADAGVGAPQLVNFRCTTVTEPMTTATYDPTTACPGGGRWVPRRPGSLLIFLTGEDGTDQRLVLGDHSSVAAAVYAPTAAINAAPHGNFFGSLVGNSVSTTGGWNFHYDEALGGQMANAPVSLQNWREIY